MAVVEIHEKKEFFSICKSFLESSSGADLGEFITCKMAERNLPNVDLIGNCTNLNSIKWGREKYQHLKGDILVFCMNREVQDFLDYMRERIEGLSERVPSDSLFIFLCNFSISSHIRRKAFEDELFTDYKVIIWDEMALLYYLSLDVSFSKSYHLSSTQERLLRVWQDYPNVIRHFESEYLLYDTKELEYSKDFFGIISYITIILEKYFDSFITNIDEVLSLRKLIPDQLEFLYRVVKYYTNQYPGTVEKQFTDDVKYMLLFWTLWNLEVTVNNQTLIVTLYNYLTDMYPKIFEYRSNAFKETLYEKLCRGIPFSQIELFSYQDTFVAGEDFIRNRQSFALFYKIINHSDACASFSEQDKQILKICCRTKKSLGNALLSIAETEMIRLPQYSDLYQINGKKGSLSILYKSEKRKNTKKRYMLEGNYKRPLHWDFSLCDIEDTANILWKIQFDFLPVGKKIRITIITDDKKSLQSIANESISQITEVIRELLSNYQQNLNTEIVALYYGEQFNGRIPERCLIFDDNIRISKIGSEHLLFETTDTEQAHIFYLNNKEYPLIKNISAIVGKNGSGKTTGFQMLAYDAPEIQKPSPIDKYVIFYRIGKKYYYSKSDSLNQIKIEGLGDEFDISNDKRKNAHVIFYRSGFSLNEIERGQTLNGTDLSDSRIYRREYKVSTRSVWEFGRKLQLYRDLQEEKFQDLFDFHPSSCYFCIPDSIYGEADFYLKVKDYIRSEKNMEGIPHCEIDIPFSNKTLDLIQYIYDSIETDYEKMADLVGILPDNVSAVCNGLSSGQYALFDFYSRLHSFFKSQDLNNTNAFNCFDIGDMNTGNYILLLDEVELYLHPAWQKRFINQLITFLEWEYSINENNIPFNSIQVLLSTNAPFFMSDLPKEKICLLSMEERIETDCTSDTFAQNIHTILKNSFFMENGLTGEFAYNKINWIFHILEHPDEDIEKYKSEILYLIKRVGEPLIQNALYDKYYKIFPTEKSDSNKQQLLKLADNMSQKGREKLLRLLEEEKCL